MATTLNLTAPPPVPPVGTDHRNQTTPGRLRAVLFNRRTAWLWALFLVSRVCVLLFLSGRETDLGVHAHFADLIRHGELPYRDFDAEYPPLALAFDTIPAFFDPTGTHYFPLFRTTLCGVDLAIWAGLLLVSFGRLAAPLLYVAGTTALGPLVYDRLDLVLGGILMAAVLVADRRRWATAGLIIGAGIAFKLVPVVLAPVLCAQAWREAGNATLGRTAAALLLVPVVTFAPFLPHCATGLSNLFRYHADRGIQLESVPATVEMSLMATTGMTGVATFDHGSFILDTRVSRQLVTATSAALAASVILFTAVATVAPSARGSNPSLLLLASLVTAVVVSKVLSPQCLLFVVPVLCVAGGRLWLGSRPVVWLAWTACVALTGTVYPFLYGRLVALDVVPCWLMIARNDILVLLDLYLIAGVVSPWRSPPPGGFRPTIPSDVRGAA